MLEAFPHNAVQPNGAALIKKGKSAGGEDDLASFSFALPGSLQGATCSGQLDLLVVEDAPAFKAVN